MAVNADYSPADIGHITKNSFNKAAKLVRDGIAHRIRDIYRGGASVDNCFHDLIEILRLSAAGIHR